MTVAMAELEALARGRGTNGALEKPSGWSIDTRTLAPGDVFFALRGAERDGHQYVAEAFRKGAAAAVVEREAPAQGRLIRVENTLRFLQALAARARARWGGKIVAVTGSAGKTTTKDAIAHLLSTRFPVGKTPGNLNNQIGVPLSILRLPEEAAIGVLELGMNHAGEIRELAGIARPDVGVVTNVGYAHVEFFDSIEAVARAKRELIEELPVTGTAVLNADDERVAAFASACRGRVVTFGFSGAARVRAEDARFDGGVTRFRAGGTEFESPLAGRHGVLNLLAAIAVCRVFGIAAPELREAVRTFAVGAMRGERLQHNGITILNDCYNSNPEAARAMLEVLAGTQARRRIAVLGEMLELGAASEALHAELGKYAAGRGIDVLIGVRGAARSMVEEARKAGMPDSAALFFENAAEAGELARRLAGAGDAVLFKGSRGVRVERALERFLGDRG